MCFVDVQSRSCVQLFETPCTAALQASLSSAISWSLLKLMSTESAMPSNHLSLCWPLLLVLSVFPSTRVSSNERLFQWAGSSHQVAKVLELQLQHQSLHWVFRFDFFRIEWFDLLAVQGTLKSLLQHHSSEASILHRSVFFMVQLLHTYMTTGKTICLC